ncbi:hypothetical protein BHE74_00044293 [Ensete ventricosum]|nr:hypothetical protein GW17_00044148 [Ensete ventricosum]RWW49529.1 hypothetical protein BHE74_00044293 [Ensete ventricosum]
MASAVASSHQQAHFFLSSPAVTVVVPCFPQQSIRCRCSTPSATRRSLLRSLIIVFRGTDNPPLLCYSVSDRSLSRLLLLPLSTLLPPSCSRCSILTPVSLRQKTGVAYDAIDGACSFPLSVIALRSNDSGDIFTACDNPGDIFTACDNPDDIFTACDNLVVKP